jgi:serine/threonine-protein kinase
LPLKSDAINWGRVTVGIALGVAVMAGAVWGMRYSAAQAGPRQPSSAQVRLDKAVAKDQNAVESKLLDHWVPQLASTKVTAGKQTSSSADPAVILAKHRKLLKRYKALLLKSDDYVFSSPGYYVSVAPKAYSTAGKALGWCKRAKLKKADCYAKYVTHDSSISRTVKHR